MHAHSRLTMIVAALTLTFLAAAPSATASHCPGTVLTVAANGTAVYVWTSTDPADGIILEVYLESNGIHGLQQGGQSILHDNPIFAFQPKCSHANPDTILL